MFKGLAEGASTQSAPQNPDAALAHHHLVGAVQAASKVLAALPADKRAELLAVKAAQPAAGLLKALGIVVDAIEVTADDVTTLAEMAISALGPDTRSMIAPLVPLIDGRSIAAAINSALVGPIRDALLEGGKDAKSS